MSTFLSFYSKNKELILYLICLASHAIFAPVFICYDYTALFLYNLTATAVYLMFLLLSANRQRHFFFAAIFSDIVFYSVFITFITGHDYGTLFFTVGMIPVIFFVSSAANEKNFHKSTFFIQSLLAAAASVLIIFRNYGSTSAFYSDFPRAVTSHKIFYISHIIFTVTVTVVYVSYMSLATEFTLKNIEEKTIQHMNELEYLANHDQLTGLMNRNKIQSYFNNSVSLKKTGGKDFSLTIFDIDHFKKINDKYGHDAGDFILKRITEVIKDMLPPDTEFARWGGEEFIILFNNYLDNTADFLNDIRNHIANTDNIWNGTNIQITLTFGLSSSRKMDNIDSVITDADNSLFYGKTT